MLMCPCHHHITTHITVQSFGDVMLFWWETHRHAFRCVSSNPFSEHVHLCDHVQTTSMGLEILTLGVHHDGLSQVPQHILTLSLPG